MKKEDREELDLDEAADALEDTTSRRTPYDPNLEFPVRTINEDV
jgi:hypothetical protein